MKAKHLYPTRLATAVSASFGQPLPPLIGVLVEKHEAQLVDEVRRDLESQGQYVPGVATMNDWHAGMQRLRDSET